MDNDIKERTLTINKVFNAPIELVWNVWSTPEHIAKWWAPKGMGWESWSNPKKNAHWWAPKGMELEIVELNFHEGGRWKYLMKMQDGRVLIAEGKYKEIVQLEKIITSADFKPMSEGLEIQIFFEPEFNKTRFSFNAVHPTAEYCKEQKERGFYDGWGSVFDGLANYLTILK